MDQTSAGDILLCDQCYDAFSIMDGADCCQQCGLVYCRACIGYGAFIRRPNECVNCRSDTLSVFDYVTVAKYLIKTLHLNGRKLIEDIRQLE